MAVRLADVAEAAGVSQATASRVLNGSTRIPKPEIAERVRAAAESLGYFPNAQAQALVRSSARLMGLVVHDISDPYFFSIARGAQRGLEGSGIQLMLASTDRGIDAEVAAVRTFMSYQTDAILLVGSRGLGNDALLNEVLGTYRANGGRVAMIGQPLPSAGGVQIANETSAAALAEALLYEGHRRFAILSGAPTLTTAAQRAAGFAGKLRSVGLRPEWLLEGGFTREGGYLMMSELLAAGAGQPDAQQPLCVFCVNDVMALGALAAVRAAGLEVPRDIAVAGFDDIPTLADQFPTVTSVKLPLEEIGQMSAEMLLVKDDEDRRIVVDGFPVLRDSTRL